MTRQQRLITRESCRDIHPTPHEKAPFNMIENGNNDIVEFKYGLPGFESLTKFQISDYKECKPFRVLKSIEDSDISMLIVDVNRIKTPSQLRIAKEDLNKINIYSMTQEVDVKVYVILMYDNSSMTFTANIKAPIIVNSKDWLGYQVILDNQNLSIHHPLTPI